ncbi:cysteine-rich secretory family protein [Yoonia sediminilitoris]|uniref:Cysteine-rich secretory protein family protein n=2 Tax=Yoonia sediminilitoris TaxID=1286148 RepID=A0A2T6KQF1_9RHOB|nr:Cysteine-rich secretory protein family protein [Yoonia sediminilitoris]RCW98933.1 cysteine-rich secretory family protein [Yoonia sediminilitoris]
MTRFGIFAIAFATMMVGGKAIASDCSAPANATALATEIAAGVNASRRANGQSPLQFNARLGRAAMAHACDMQVNSFFDHRGSDGSSSQVRVQKAGYNDCIVAENLAWGYPRAAQIVSGWMNSPGHRRNMLHPRIQEFGIGITQGPKGPYWVLVVGKSC